MSLGVGTLSLADVKPQLFADNLKCSAQCPHALFDAGALPLGFQVKLGLVRGKCIPGGLHAAEASYVSASSLGAFRAAIVRSVWSSKVPLANTPAVLILLDGPVGVDPALHIVWVRFQMMRRYLAYCPGEVPRIFRMLDLISRGALVMALCIFCSFLLLSLVLPGMGMKRAGCDHLFLPLGCGCLALSCISQVGRKGRFPGSSVCVFERIFTTTSLFPPEGKR